MIRQIWSVGIAHPTTASLSVAPPRLWRRGRRRSRHSPEAVPEVGPVPPPAYPLWHPAHLMAVKNSRPVTWRRRPAYGLVACPMRAAASMPGQTPDPPGAAVFLAAPGFEFMAAPDWARPLFRASLRARAQHHHEQRQARHLVVKASSERPRAGPLAHPQPEATPCGASEQRPRRRRLPEVFASLGMTDQGGHAASTVGTPLSLHPAVAALATITRSTGARRAVSPRRTPAPMATRGTPPPMDRRPHGRRDQGRRPRTEVSGEGAPDDGHVHLPWATASTTRLVDSASRSRRRCCSRRRWARSHAAPGPPCGRRIVVVVADEVDARCAAAGGEGRPARETGRPTALARRMRTSRCNTERSPGPGHRLRHADHQIAAAASSVLRRTIELAPMCTGGCVQLHLDRFAIRFSIPA